MYVAAAGSQLLDQFSSLSCLKCRRRRNRRRRRKEKEVTRSISGILNHFICSLHCRNPTVCMLFGWCEEEEVPGDKLHRLGEKRQTPR